MVLCKTKYYLLTNDWQAMMNGGYLPTTILRDPLPAKLPDATRW